MQMQMQFSNIRNLGGCKYNKSVSTFSHNGNNPSMYAIIII
jgi:hypothetical protein